MIKLKNGLEGHFIQIMIMPLLGTRSKFTGPQEAIATLDILDLQTSSGDFQRFERGIDDHNKNSIPVPF